MGDEYCPLNDAYVFTLLQGVFGLLLSGTLGQYCAWLGQ